MPILNWTEFRRDCKVLLEGRGNRDQRNALDRGLHFRIAKTFSLGSCLLFLRIDAKKLEIYIFKEDERRLYQLLQLVCPVFFLSSLVQIKHFSTECLALHSGEEL
jgi:hypothetical protein